MPNRATEDVKTSSKLSSDIKTGLSCLLLSEVQLTGVVGGGQNTVLSAPLQDKGRRQVISCLPISRQVLSCLLFSVVLIT